MNHYIFGDLSAPDILIQMVDDHDLSVIENEAAHIRELSGKPFGLIAFKVNQWNMDLSPWKAPAVFGNEDFGDGARRTLDAVLEDVRTLVGFRESARRLLIGGYSLAGLFALWAVYETDAFSGAAAASPSIWFPGMIDYMKAHEIHADKVYLSLGDKEAKTRNPVMASVADRIREGYEWLAGTGTDCVLEWNPGNHFREPDLRTAKAFAWLLS